MRFSSAWLLLGLAGCLSDAPPPDATRSDAASRVFADLSSSPTLSLGGPAAVGPAQFSGIYSLIVDPSGSIWVTDAQSQELRVFNSTGQHLFSVGGKGEGPGEYRNVALAGLTPDDQVLAFDGFRGRVTTYDLDGTLARTEMLAHPGVAPGVVGVLSDGTLVGQTPVVFPVGPIGAATYTDTVRFFGWRSVTGSPDTIAATPGMTLIVRENGFSRMPLAPHARSTTSGSLFMSSGPEFEIEVVAVDGSTRKWVADREPQPADGRVISEYRAYLERAVSPASLARQLDALEHPDLPEYTPAYSELVPSSPSGVWARIWVAAADGAGTWDVFDDEGTLRGQVQTPAGFRVKSINGDLVTGVFQDSLGVEYLQQYRLTRR